MKIIRKLTLLVFTAMLTFSALGLCTSAAEAQQVFGIGFVNASSLRLRSQASTSASIVATASQNDCVVILQQTGDWYLVNFNLQTGYMHKDYLTVRTAENAELGYGRIIGSGVNLRSGPSTGNAVAAVTSAGSKCYVIGVNNGWYKVIYGDTIGYIRSDFVELTEIPYENRASSNAPKFFRGGKSTGVKPSAAALNGTSFGTAVQPSPVTGSSILAEAQKYLGVPYVNGGASPSGFDCSGFVYYVLKQCGFSPYRTPADQWNQGSQISKDELQPGDIVFFANTYTSGLSHVGIYAGGGQFIHAPNSRSTVSYSDLTSGYWAEHYYGARRMG